MDTERVYALDLETTYNGSPYVPGDRVVRGGIMSYADRASYLVPHAPQVDYLNGLGVSLIVGFNLGFDLPWCYKADGAFQTWMGTKVRIWDCQLAEFILGGMREPYPSLDNVCERRGLGRKSTEVSDLWAAGVKTEDIHTAVLDHYLLNDLALTLDLFQEQVREATERDMLVLIMQQMECLQATIDMTYNGMTIDKPRLKELESEFVSRQLNARHTMEALVKSLGYLGDWNPNSAQQVGLMLHGGEYEYYLEESAPPFKSGSRKGLPRTARVLTKTVLKGYAMPIGKLTSSGAPATDESTLREHLAEAVGDCRMFLESLLEHREVTKQLNTYILGLPQHECADGVIHHSINHCVARTGRLTSSNPNLQNVTNGPVKAAFVPPDGYQWLVEHDFAQLEMVALALISGDAQLIEDIASGMDMHTHFYIRIYDEKPSKEQRTKFKRLMFGLVYGAGAKKLAITSGLPLRICEAFIGEFYGRYLGVAKYHETILDMARELGYHGVMRDKETGHPIKEYLHKSMTGRVYHFCEYAKPFGRKGDFGFSPTELKNRPIQGWATADIVPLAIGLLYRWVYRENWAVLLLNTVHDSVLSAVQGSEKYAVDYAKMAAHILETVKERFERSYDVTLSLPLKVSASIGPNWLDQKEIDRSGILALDIEEKDYTWLLHPES